MRVYDIVRSLFTNAMLLLLLFTLARPKVGKKTLGLVLTGIVVLDLALNIAFYVRNDYTTLAALDIAFFVLMGATIKPLFYETPMQWLFNCFTVMNTYAVTVIISYCLCGFFPHPYYAITALRVALFAGVIALFTKRLRPLYRQATEHWSVYLFVAVGLFLNFMWYFVSSDDVEQTLTQSVVPLLLLVALTVLVYAAIFVSLRKTLRAATLLKENLKIQAARELTCARLALMDEAVRQMTIVQHDQRHFNNMLLSLLQQGQQEKAVKLIQKQGQMFPQKPQSYCQNVSVNAAVSYYAEVARRQGVRCELRLDIPEKLSVDELSLATAVSNLMENAITAVCTLPEKQRELRFTAIYTGQLLLELTNPYSGQLTLSENGIPLSTNKGHGKGCSSVHDFVTSCGGSLVFETEGGLCKVRMMV